jgi:hypothetical protein
MYPRTLKRDSNRGVLWGEREVLLPHLLEHQCPVTDEVREMCVEAEWTYESYLLAVLFDVRELLVTVTK